jgi:hypothetical protein
MSSMNTTVTGGMREMRMTAVMRSAAQKSVTNTMGGRSIKTINDWEEVDSGSTDIAGEVDMMTAP